MNSKFICVFGQMFSGKTTIVNYLSEDWERISFAGPLKGIFCDTFGVDSNFVKKWKPINEIPPNFDMTVRESLIQIGNGFRNIRSTIWIDKALEKIANKSAIDDGRFTNELIAVKNRGGITILVWRHGYENDIKNESESQMRPLIDYYISTGIEGLIEHDKLHGNKPVGYELVDYFIRNEGTLEDLEEKVLKIEGMINE